MAAISDALDGVTLSRDDLHEAAAAAAAEGAAALVPRLPEPPRAARAAGDGGAARPAVHRRPRRAPAGVRPHRPARRLGRAARDGGRRELVRRYLAAYGPSTPAHFAEWAGIGKAHARELWASVDEEPAGRPAAGRGRAAARARRSAAARPRPRDGGAGSGAAQEGVGGDRRRRRRARRTARRSRCGGRASRASGSRSRSRAGTPPRAALGGGATGTAPGAAAAVER